MDSDESKKLLTDLYLNVEALGGVFENKLKVDAMVISTLSRIQKTLLVMLSGDGEIAEAYLSSNDDLKFEFDKDEKIEKIEKIEEAEEAESEDELDDEETESDSDDEESGSNTYETNNAAAVVATVPTSSKKTPTGVEIPTGVESGISKTELKLKYPTIHTTKSFSSLKNIHSNVDIVKSFNSIATGWQLKQFLKKTEKEKQKKNKIITIKSMTTDDVSYEVDVDDKTCTCPAFMYGEGKACKHLVMILSKKEIKEQKEQKEQKAHTPAAYPLAPVAPVDFEIIGVVDSGTIAIKSDKSSGKIYLVNMNDNTCTCPEFKHKHPYSHGCDHISFVKEEFWKESYC